MVHRPENYKRFDVELLAKYKTQVQKGQLSTCPRCNGKGKILGLASNLSPDGIYTCPLCLGEMVLYASKERVYCDYCDDLAIYVQEVLNPADETEGVEGAYGVIYLCQKHRENQIYLEELFYCKGCGRLFITRIGREILAAVIGGKLYCQKCSVDIASSDEKKYGRPYPIINSGKEIRCAFFTIVIKVRALARKYNGGIQNFVQSYTARCNKDIAVMCAMSEWDLEILLLDLDKNRLQLHEDFECFNAADEVIFRDFPLAPGMVHNNDVTFKCAWLKGYVKDGGVIVRYSGQNEKMDPDDSDDKVDKSEAVSTSKRPSLYLVAGNNSKDTKVS